MITYMIGVLSGIVLLGVTQKIQLKRLERKAEAGEKGDEEH